MTPSTPRNPSKGELSSSLQAAKLHLQQSRWGSIKSGRRYSQIADWWISSVGDLRVGVSPTGVGLEIISQGGGLTPLGIPENPGTRGYAAPGQPLAPQESLGALAYQALQGTALGSTSRRKYITVLGMLLRAAAEIQGLPRDSLVSRACLPTYRAATGRRKPVTATEASEVLRHLSQLNSSCGRLGSFLEATGCRLGEALALGPSQEAQVTLRNTKSRSDRTIPLPERAQRALRVGWAGLTEATFRHYWRRAADLAGTRATPHCLRHAAITRWVRNGVPLPVVQELAGHADIKTTMGYVHIEAADLAVAMEQR